LLRRHLAEALDPGLLLRRLRRDRVDHAGPGERRDAVRAHLEALHVERDAARQPDDAEFGRHVIGLAEIADQRRGRGHVHEGAGILLAELYRAGPAHVEGAVEVHGEHIRPVRPAHAVEDAVAQDAGIVHQDVDAAERGKRRLDDLVGVLRLGDRERGSDRLAALALDFIDHRLRGAGVGAGAFETRADVADPDLRPLLRHEQRDAAADAAARTGNDCDLAADDARSHGYSPFVSLAPDLVGDLDQAAQLRPLLVLGQAIALLGRGEAALARD